MNGNSVLKYGRPSVLKWVGKNLTRSDEDLQTRAISTVENIQVHTIVPQEYRQTSISDESPGNQGPIINEDLRTRAISTVGNVQVHTVVPQEYNQTSISDESPGNQGPIINEDLRFLPNSTNAGKIHSCKVCKRTFKWRSHLQCHERIHTDERPFQCNICDKAFKRSDGLQCHKKVHYKIKVSGDGLSGSSYVLDETALRQQNIFPCTICGRTFVSLAGYSRHIDNKHKDQNDLKCDICNIIFNRPSALEIHSRVHTGLKPYCCDICLKSFSIQGNLKRHLLIHSGERPYKCTFCDNCFNNSSHLARHIKSKHEKQ